MTDEGICLSIVYFFVSAAVFIMNGGEGSLSGFLPIIAKNKHSPFWLKIIGMFINIIWNSILFAITAPCLFLVLFGFVLPILIYKSVLTITYINSGDHHKIIGKSLENSLIYKIYEEKYLSLSKDNNDESGRLSITKD